MEVPASVRAEPKVFSYQRVLSRELEQAYYPDAKRKVLGDLVCRLVIPAYDAVGGVCHVFRTPHHALLTADKIRMQSK